MTHRLLEPVRHGLARRWDHLGTSRIVLAGLWLDALLVMAASAWNGGAAFAALGQHRAEGIALGLAVDVALAVALIGDRALHLADEESHWGRALRITTAAMSLALNCGVALWQQQYGIAVFHAFLPLLLVLLSEYAQDTTLKYNKIADKHEAEVQAAEDAARAEQQAIIEQQRAEHAAEVEQQQTTARQEREMAVRTREADRDTAQARRDEAQAALAACWQPYAAVLAAVASLPQSPDPATLKAQTDAANRAARKVKRKQRDDEQPPAVDTGRHRSGQWEQQPDIAAVPAAGSNGSAPKSELGRAVALALIVNGMDDPAAGWPDSGKVDAWLPAPGGTGKKALQDLRRDGLAPDHNHQGRWEPADEPVFQDAWNTARHLVPEKLLPSRPALVS